MAITSIHKFKRRQYRVRNKIKSKVKPRLSVFRSGKHIYAQLIDDANGVTIAAASSIEKDFLSKNKVKSTSDAKAAEVVGCLVAERAKKKKVETCVFDRGAYLFHGRVKALAEGARKVGLKF